MKLSHDELAARQELLCEKYDSIKGLVRFFGVPVDIREDVVQEIFVLAYKHLYQLKDVESMDSWLYKIAYRHVLSHKKKNQKKEAFEVPLEDQLLNIKDESNAEKVWHIAEYELSDEELIGMIDSLKPPAPDILRLRFKMGFTLVEIAKILDMNYNSVKTIEHRAFKKLKKMIEQRGKRNDA